MRKDENILGKIINLTANEYDKISPTVEERKPRKLICIEVVSSTVGLFAEIGSKGMFSLQREKKNIFERIKSIIDIEEKELILALKSMNDEQTSEIEFKSSSTYSFDQDIKRLKEINIKIKKIDSKITEKIKNKYMIKIPGTIKWKLGISSSSHILSNIHIIDFSNHVFGKERNNNNKLEEKKKKYIKSIKWNFNTRIEILNLKNKQ